VQGRHRLLRRFGYDAVYRLTFAAGRACNDIGVPRPLADLARCGAADVPYVGGRPSTNTQNAPELTEHYTESYGYDPLGNMLELHYQAASGQWTRGFGMDNLPPEAWREAKTNRLTSLTQNGTPHTFAYDENGNMIRQNTERYYAWDHADRMIGFTNRVPGSDCASVEARYLYGADGIRVKKWVRKNGTGDGESRAYIDEVFEHQRWEVGENNHLHVMDDQQRVAIIRRGDAHPKDTGPTTQYHLGDHLGSSNVALDGAGQWVNHEEFFPYGEISFGGFARKRYRFTGQERDQESGLSYHGARYYAPSLCRWICCDPLLNPRTGDTYTYSRDNPIMMTDTAGTQPSVIPSVNSVSLEYAETSITEEGRVVEAKSASVSLELTISTTTVTVTGREQIAIGFAEQSVPENRQAYVPTGKIKREGIRVEVAGELLSAGVRETVSDVSSRNISTGPIEGSPPIQRSEEGDLQKDPPPIKYKTSEAAVKEVLKSKAEKSVKEYLGQEERIVHGTPENRARHRYRSRAASRQLKMLKWLKWLNRIELAEEWLLVLTTKDPVEQSRKALDAFWSSIPHWLGIWGGLFNDLGQWLAQRKVGGRTIHESLVRAPLSAKIHEAAVKLYLTDPTCKGNWQCAINVAECTRGNLP
jgi:RHS repeat-associated protein